VNIHVTGLNALEQLISLLPAGEFVTWLSGPRSDDPQYAIDFALPPADDVAAIKTYADQHSLNLNVFFPVRDVFLSLSAIFQLKDSGVLPFHPVEKRDPAS